MDTKTKIITTLGPSTESYESIKELAKAGADVFRLNTSHGDVESHTKLVKTIRKVAKDLNLFLGIIVDLQGPKIRVGKISSPYKIEVGKVFYLKHSDKDIANDVVPVDYKGISKDVKTGDKILLDDGKVGLVVTNVVGNIVTVKVLWGEEIKSGKGVNIPNATPSLSALTTKDKKFAKFAIENDVDYLALSFVKSPKDITSLRKYLKANGGDIPIISKIEKPEALEVIDEIIQVSDGIMVARGDLGIEMSPEEVPLVQKRIVKLTIYHRKACIVATQMLESMITEPIPTRAEASDVANAILDGADAVMLSGETAVGKHPVEAVKIMNSIAKNVETTEFSNLNAELDITGEYEITPQSISNAAVKLTKDLQAKAIISFTHSGYTPKLLSKLRPNVPIFAISDSDTTCRRLNLYRDVYPYRLDLDTAPDKNALKKIDKFLKQFKEFKTDERVVIIGSTPTLITGRTNFIRVHRISATDLNKNCKNCKNCK